jgi:monoamine oxidase
MFPMMHRRSFLTSTSLLAAASMMGCATTRKIDGELLGNNFTLGHQLRDGELMKRALAAKPEEIKTDVLIVGGGVAGLSAAWQLAKFNTNFLLCELEADCGGNSRTGQSPVTAYPWGAHYVPLPTMEAVETRELLADLGVITAGALTERPTYDERYLCHTPAERMFERGLWHESLLPKAEGDAKAQAEIQRFKALMDEYKQARGADGLRVFASPVARSSTDPKWLALDNITMAQWLAQNGFESAPLKWLVNYGCRDDYGTDYTQISAWVGLHYFASRTAHAMHADGDTVLTWPEGNGFITNRLAQKFAKHIRKGAAVIDVQTNPQRAQATVYLAQENRTLLVTARHIIWAAPLFIAARVIRGLSDTLRAAQQRLSYAPWIIANLHVRDLPLSRGDAAIAWDNVLMDSPALGYVVATHQQLKGYRGASVLSYYWPLSDLSPQESRKQLLEAPWQRWADAVLLDLERPHADIRSITRRIDIWRNAHAMLRPEPGVVWGMNDPTNKSANPIWQRMRPGMLRLHFAHSDMSGLSLFEEANYQGVHTAKACIASTLG